MKTIAEKLQEQITQAQKIGQKILEISGLNYSGIIYAFATSDVLVINCQDYNLTYLFDEEQGKLWQGISKLKLPIQTTIIEKSGKTFSCW
jgi:hypothetical protein